MLLWPRNIFYFNFNIRCFRVLAHRCFWFFFFFRTSMRRLRNIRRRVHTIAIFSVFVLNTWRIYFVMCIIIINWITFANNVLIEYRQKALKFLLTWCLRCTRLIIIIVYKSPDGSSIQHNTWAGSPVPVVFT